jgi:hypothetical protein
MAGIHGKNATVRVSTTQTILSGVEMTGTPGGMFQAGSTQRNWRYDRENTLIQFTTGAAQGHPTLVNDANGVDINTQTRFINYAGGAIHLGAYPAVLSGVYAMAVSMELSTVANLVSDNRNFTVNIESDSLDSTVMGESWKSFEEGLMGFSGSLEGLSVDTFWYRQAVQTLSGLAPRTVIRFQVDPRRSDTYYQGTVVFPSFEFSAGFDSLVERSVNFQGRGPLDLIQAGVPFFKTSDTA